LLLEDRQSIEQCLRGLGSTDPRDEKERIEAGKDSLLKECYAWILDDPDFRCWRDSGDSKLLWIKGDPGKGKTMMMIALAEELSRQPEAWPEAWPRLGFLWPIVGKLIPKPSPCIVSYFFCQRTDSRLNNAISVLKGLIYRLVAQETSLIRHIKRYDNNDSGQVFDSPNAVYALRGILRDILNDSTLPRTYLLVDALDECSIGLHQLLDIITDDRFITQSKIKWLVSSRNQPEIEERLRPDGARMRVSLELNSARVSTAVTAFINFKVRELALRKQYDTKFEEEVKRELFQKSEATFLWVALACKRLGENPIWKTSSVLKDLLPGLEPLYGQMMDQILYQGDDTVEFCKEILRSAVVAYRPLRLQELVATAKLPSTILDSVQSLTDLVHRCGSFLTTREETIYFIHQSAKDYLVTGNGRKIFCASIAEEHGKIMHRSLDILSKSLKKDLCDLRDPGTLINEARGKFSKSSLHCIEYACSYWVYHLSDHVADSSCAEMNRGIFSDGGKVHKFLQMHLLHWLEALSLSGRLTDGVLMAQQLRSIVDVSMPSIS
jgi:hypothetical protein